MTGNLMALHLQKRLFITVISRQASFLPLMRHFFSLLAVLALPLAASGHAVPDIPVRTWFTQGGGCTVTVEVDPRCFAADPNAEPSLLNAVFPGMSEAARTELKTKAAELVQRYVEFLFEPTGPVKPEFSFEFTGHAQAPLALPEDIVVMTGTWQTRVPEGSMSWRIKATKDTPLAVVFRNYLEGLESPKFSVLFPGETSFPFDFKQAPEPLQDVVFGSCINATEHPMLDRAASLPMDLFLLMGDNIYADTNDMMVMREKYQALAASSFFQTVRGKAPILATWDDHDLGQNDGGADYKMKRESQTEFWNWLGEPASSPKRKQEGVYQARVFGPEGKRVQVIMMDARYFRSPLNRVPKEKGSLGGTAVPHTDTSTTILGEAQWKWLEGVLKQPAEVRLLVSSIQFAAQAHGGESWANFPHEQKRLVDLIRSTRANGIVVLSGDRHWCEFSTLTEGAPYPLHDITASSMTQIHERGTPTPNQNRSLPQTYHRPNIGTLHIDWQQPDPAMTLRILDVEGKAQLEKVVRLGELKPR
jgi:alkaline phosphatase D